MFLRLVVAVLVLTVAACSRQRTSVAVDAALLTQVPGDTIALGAMRVKALKETTAWKKLLEQPGVNAQLDKLAEETSFDPRNNLWEILWSTDGKESLVYARGEFAPMGLEPKIAKEGIQRLNYRGSMLLGNEEYAVWFINSSTGIFGHTAKLRSMIDARDKGDIGPSAALRERIDKLPPQSHFWLVADAQALPQLPPLENGAKGGMAMNFMQNLPKLMQSVQMTTFDMSLVDGMALQASAYCDSETGARQMHDTLKGLVGLARIALPERQKTVLMPLLDGIEVTQKESEATLRARLTVEQFEKMQSLLLSPRAQPKATD